MRESIEIFLQKVKQSLFLQLIFCSLTLFLAIMLGMSFTLTVGLTWLSWGLVVWPPSKLPVSLAIFFMALSPLAYYLGQPINAEKFMGIALLLLMLSILIVLGELTDGQSDIKD